jgi:hypothetical protein
MTTRYIAKFNAKTGKMITRWITVKMDRHADFGGGAIAADLPDTESHRAAYAGRILREWSQVVDAQ